MEGFSFHVHQRGNNRSDMFLDDFDRTVFLNALCEASRRHEVTVHHWVLMRNHFHLVATPASPDGIPRTVQQTGRRYVPYFNRRHRRTGGLWEGRYSAHLIDTETYWYRCMRYVELNPVRAGVVCQPHEHPWSSYHLYAYGGRDPLAKPHPLQLALGATPFERQAAHRALCGAPLTDAELASIRCALRSGTPPTELPDALRLTGASPLSL